MRLLKFNGTHFPVPIGQYIDWIHGEKEIKTFALQCPTCHRAFCLANHIVKDGQVTPSVVCPFSCGFHEMLQLS